MSSVLVLLLSACGQAPAPATATAKPVAATAIGTPFSLYADGSTVRLNIPRNLSNKTTWSLATPVGTLSGAGRHGSYTTPATLKDKTSVQALLSDPGSGKTYALTLNLLPKSLKPQDTGTPPDGTTLCAQEGGNCIFTGQKAVAYGANGNYTYKLATDGTDCNNMIFGDPLVGTVKSCYSGDASLMNQGGPAGFTYCSAEDDTCTFTDSANVAYGANGHYAVKTKMNGTACTNEVFGDPLGGVKKACYLGTSTGMPTGYTFCALENQSCTFTGTQKVAYGADGKFVYLDQTDGTSCTNDVFTDPDVGVGKACYLAVASGGSSDSDDKDGPTPVANIKIDSDLLKPSISAGNDAFFEATDIADDDLTYTWSFGDGASDTGPATAHQYTQPGYYTATMTVKNTVGDTHSESATVAVLPDVNDMPAARAAAMGQTSTFNVQYPVNGLTYQWDFGDGQQTTGSKLSHQFTTPGFHDVALTIYDDRHPLASGGVRTVLSELQTRVNIIPTKPEAKFLMSSAGPGQVTVDASTSTVGANDNLTYGWDFGDGGTATGLSSSHTYAQDGVYPVTLTVTEQYGLQSTVHKVAVSTNKHSVTVFTGDSNDGGPLECTSCDAFKSQSLTLKKPQVYRNTSSYPNDVTAHIYINQIDPNDQSTNVPDNDNYLKLLDNKNIGPILIVVHGAGATPVYTNADTGTWKYTITSQNQGLLYTASFDTSRADYPEEARKNSFVYYSKVPDILTMHATFIYDENTPIAYHYQAIGMDALQTNSGAVGMVDGRPYTDALRYKGWSYPDAELPEWNDSNTFVDLGGGDEMAWDFLSLTGEKTENLPNDEIIYMDVLHKQYYNSSHLIDSLLNYSFILPSNPQEIRVHHYFYRYDAAIFENNNHWGKNINYTVSVNGNPSSKAQSDEPQPYDLYSGSYVAFHRPNFPSSLPSGDITHRVSPGSRPLGDNSTGPGIINFDTKLKSFSSLRVPNVALSIIPDTQLDDSKPQEYAYDRNGQKSFFEQVNIPESAITSDGYVNFTVPIYAVDEKGNLLTQLNGAFPVQFADTRIKSKSREGLMIRGRGEISVSVPVAMFSDGATSFDFSAVKVGPSDCGTDDRYAVYGSTLTGCQTITTTDQLPQGLSVSADTSNQGSQAFSPQAISGKRLHPQAITFAQVKSWVGSVKSSAFNAVNMGKTALSRLSIDKALKAYDGSSVSIAIGFVPIIGDSVDLLQQVYNVAAGKGVDPVVTVFAAAGLAIDAFTGAGGEGFTAIKSIYKISKAGGGVLAKSISESVISLISGGKKAIEVLTSLTAQFSVFVRAFISEGTSGIKVLDNMIKGISGLASCGLSASQSIKSLSCSKTDAFKVVGQIARNLFDARVSSADVLGSLLAVCCAPPEGGGYVKGVELLVDRLRTANAATLIRGVYGEMKAMIIVRKAGFKNLEFVDKYTLKSGKVVDPDAIGELNGIVHVFEFKNLDIFNKVQLQGLLDLAAEKGWRAALYTGKNSFRKNPKTVCDLLAIGLYLLNDLGEYVRVEPNCEVEVKLRRVVNP